MQKSNGKENAGQRQVREADSCAALRNGKLKKTNTEILAAPE
jgi:hypothetical protein